MDSFDYEGLEKTGRELHFVERLVGNLSNYIRTRFPGNYQTVYDPNPAYHIRRTREKYALFIGIMFFIEL